MQAEIEFLSGPAIGSLAARDPRGVKRLVNVYRLVRARLSAEELDGLLGTGDRAPAFGLLAIATAVETGQPAAVADKFYGHLQSLRTAEDFEAWATGWTPADPVGAALKALSGLLAQHKTRPAAQHLMLALQARRYSFNRYR